MIALHEYPMNRRRPASPEPRRRQHPPAGSAVPAGRRLGAVLLWTAALAWSGCAVGPSYHPPAPALPPSFTETGDWVPARPADDLSRGPWWEAFGDTTLDRLESQVEVSSNSLAEVEAQYESALAVAGIAQAALFPTLSLDASASRGQAAARNGARQPTTNTFSATLSSAWELDLWGRLRRARQEGLAQAEASAADLESARLSLHALLAQTYFSLRAVEADRRLIDRLTRGYEQSLRFTRNQYDVGVVARSEVDASVAQLKQAQAQGVDLALQRAQLEHALALVLGRFPEEFALAPSDTLIEPPTPPLVLPSLLLQRRPDVAAAERRLAAASAGIGVAVSGYFPSLSLSGTAGYQGSTLSRLFSVPNQVWSAGPALAQTILDSGRTRAGVKQARALYEQSLAAYRQSVLSSFADVEDGLAAVRILTEEKSVQDTALVAARRGLQQTLDQYRAGTVSHLNVITAQATLLDAERAAADLEGRRLQAAVALYKAMGGNPAADTR